MHNIIKLILFSFSFIAFCLTSCKKDDEKNTTPIDTIRPVITLNGLANMDVILNGTFTDPGATATDNGNQISVDVAGAVNVNHTGNYPIAYGAVDASNNISLIYRMVHVYNQAEIFAGTYDHSYDSCNNTFSANYSASVIVSDTINKLAAIKNFGAFGNTVSIKTVFTGNTTNSPIDIDNYQSLGGSAVLGNIVTGGTYVLSGTSPTSFVVSYMWNDSINYESCFSVYLR